MLEEKLKKQIVEAMKAKNEIRLSTLKMLSSELHNARIEKMGDLTDDDEIKVIQKEVKKRKDAIEAYVKGGRQELVERETAELAVLEELAPEEMSREEVEKLVQEVVVEVGASSMTDMGRVMSAVMAKVAGRADGKVVSELVREKLQ